MTSIVIGFFSSDINECETDLCENGGSCENTIGSFTCTCAAGYDGDTCENGKDTWILYNNLNYFVRSYIKYTRTSEVKM